MARTVIGGIVSTDVNARKSPPAEEVENIVFESLSANIATPPIGTEGIMILRTTFSAIKMGDTLYYQDGNANNNAVFQVTSVVGPTKFKVKRTL